MPTSLGPGFLEYTTAQDIRLVSKEPAIDFLRNSEREEYYCTLFSYGYYPHKSSFLPLNRGLLGLINWLKTFLSNFNLLSIAYAGIH